MADRSRQSRDRNQPGSSDDWPRQSEQFESDRSHQQNLNSDWNDRGGSQDRQQGANRSWQERERGPQSSWQDSMPGRDRDEGSYGTGRQTRKDTSHSYFTGDDFGGGEQTSDFGRRTYGGNAMGGSNFARSGYSQYRGNDSSSERGLLDRAGDEVASWFGDEQAAQRREQDHRGRGPDGYTRTDQRILEDACDRLTEDRGVDASGITVSVDKGELTLGGTITDRMQKRRAEDCVETVSGVKHVQNNLRIAAKTTDTVGNGKPAAPLI